MPQKPQVLKKIFVNSEAEQKVRQELGEFIKELGGDDIDIKKVFEAWIYYRPKKNRYLPSRKTIENLLFSLNESSAEELVLPGRFNPSLFVTDLFKYPVLSKDRLCQQLFAAMNNTDSYLDFFIQTRGYPRWVIPLPFNAKVWKLFETRPDLMMQFPECFEELHSVVVPTETQVKMLKTLTKTKPLDYSKLQSLEFS